MNFQNITNIARNAWGLVIKAASNAAAKTVNTVNLFINGVFAQKTAWDVALTNYTYVNSVWTVTTAAFTLADWYTAPLTVYATWSAFAVWLWTVSANTGSVYATDFDRSLVSKGYAIIGYIIVKNATGSTFTWGTTALDTANLTVTYIDSFSTTWI